MTCEKSIERHVFPELGHALHRVPDFRKEIVRRDELAVAQRPALAARAPGGVDCGGVRFVEQREGRLRTAVYELCAQLDRNRQPGLVMRPDAAADAIARFEQQGGTPSSRESFRSGEACRARAYDDDVLGGRFLLSATQRRLPPGVKYAEEAGA